VLWPRESTGSAESGRAEFPVVLLEVQMHRDPGFHHRLAAQTYRLLLKLLTLPVRPENELAASSRQILASRADLDTVVLPMLVQRFPQLTAEQVAGCAGLAG